MSDTYVCKSCGAELAPEVALRRPGCPECDGLEFRIKREGASRCDFCSDKDVRHSYPCRTFEQPAIMARSDGSTLRTGSIGWWAACERCYELIEADDRDGLAERSVANLAPMNLPVALVRQQIRSLHDSFFANREGAPLEHMEAPHGT